MSGSANPLVLILIAILPIIYIKFIKPPSSSARLPPSPPGWPIIGNLLSIPAYRAHPLFHQLAQKYAPSPLYMLKLGSQRIVVVNKAPAAHALFVDRSALFSTRAAPHVAQDIISRGQRMVFLNYTDEWKAARKALAPFLGKNAVASEAMRKMQESEAGVAVWDLMHNADVKGQQVLFKPTSPIEAGDRKSGLGKTSANDKVGTDDNSDGIINTTARGTPGEDHWLSSIHRYTTSIAMVVAYGARANSIIGNRRLHKINELMANFSVAAQPGTYLADAFPWMRWKVWSWFGLDEWRKRAKKMHEWELNLFGGWIRDVQDALTAGDSIPSSFVGDYLKTRATGIDSGNPYHLPGIDLVAPHGSSKKYLSDTLLAYTAGTVLEAGSDTSAATLSSFILFMLNNPPVLARARAEMDNLNLSDPPTFVHQSKLPYLTACIKETLRRRPPSIMGIPHSADEDQVYEGMLIPKGSVVVGNVWAIHMDPERFPNPTAFLPERFYTPPDAPEDWVNPFQPKSPDERDHYAFGWGRRLCQGFMVAEASIWILAARMLWALEFEFDKTPLADGTIPTLPDPASESATWSDGFISIPLPYPVKWTARSEEKKRKVETMFEDAQRLWEDMGVEGDVR